MKRSLLMAVYASLMATGSIAFAEDEYSGDAYATCSACHLPDGVGVPSAFPPIRNRVSRIAELDGGREYLVTVVTYGLMGTIEVQGVQYFGVMAGNAGPMTPADIAAVINYVVFELNDGEVNGVDPFTAEEVEEIQSAIAMKSPAGGGQLRSELTGKYGDEWP